MGFHFLMMCQCKNPPWDQFLCTTNLYLWSDSYLDNLVWTKIIFFVLLVYQLQLYLKTPFLFFVLQISLFMHFHIIKFPVVLNQCLLHISCGFTPAHRGPNKQPVKKKTRQQYSCKDQWTVSNVLHIVLAIIFSNRQSIEQTTFCFFFSCLQLDHG